MSFNATPVLPPGVEVGIAESARVWGALRLAPDAHLAQGSVVRSSDQAVEIGAGSVLLENGAVVGSAAMPVRIGRKVVFGHRSVVLGAEVGDLCEIGNATILLPGARLGRRCFTGEGTLVPAGMVVPDDSVLVGRPARRLRGVEERGLVRLRGLRSGDLSLPEGVPPLLVPGPGTRPDPEEESPVGTLYRWQDKAPQVDPGAYLFDSAEITGDVVIGPGSVIGAGVKIMGDSHGPVRIGANVQILEGTVLHLLPDNELVIEDDVVVGPAAMVHGCRLGVGTVVEPGAIVCDGSDLGAGCLVTAGTLVRQRDTFPARTVVTGFPGVPVGSVPGERPEPPAWALRPEQLVTLQRVR